MLDRAVDDVGDDLHVAVRVHAERPAAVNDVVVEHAQVAEPRGPGPHGARDQHPGVLLVQRRPEALDVEAPGQDVVGDEDDPDRDYVVDESPKIHS